MDGATVPYLGIGRLPQRLVSLIESSPNGRKYLIELADKLLTAYRRVKPGLEAVVFYSPTSTDHLLLRRCQTPLRAVVGDRPKQ